MTCAANGIIQAGVVVLRGSRIERVAAAREFEGDELSHASVEHFPDGTLLPGMVDEHAHLTLAADRRTYEEMILDPDEKMALVSVSKPATPPRVWGYDPARQRGPQSRHVHRARGDPAVEAALALRRPTTAHCRARQSMLNAVEAGLDCIEHGELSVPGKVVEYGQGIASSGVMEYDPRVTDRLLEAGRFVSYTMQAGGYDTLVGGAGRGPTDRGRAGAARQPRSVLRDEARHLSAIAGGWHVAETGNQ
jgi:imidazolonepropionase-like amidohydrolase